MGTQLDVKNLQLNGVEEKLIQDIKDTGWSAIFIPSHDGIPSFCYTVGCKTHMNTPEFVICGLDHEVAHKILTAVISRIETSGLPEMSKAIDGIANVPLSLHPASSEFTANHMDLATWFYQDQSVDAVQVVWPDKNSNFPWQDGFDQNAKFAQMDLSGNAWSNLQ